MMRTAQPSVLPGRSLFLRRVLPASGTWASRAGDLVIVISSAYARSEREARSSFS
jgi:hypothetical protein